MTDDNDDEPSKSLSRWMGGHLYEPTRKPDAGGRHAPRLPRFLPSLVILLVVGSIATWFVFVGLARLRGSNVDWIWPDIGSLSDDGALFDVTRSTATLAALVGGLFAAVYAYRKQRVDEAAGKRADDEALSKRYQDAAEQLGHGKASVRLAGAYALARLADDWPEQRQTCIDVLCSYARQKLTQDVSEQALEHPVRKAIWELIVQHTRPGNYPTSWSSARLDLTGAHFEDSLSSIGGRRVDEVQRVTLRHKGEFLIKDSVFSTTRAPGAISGRTLGRESLLFEIRDQSRLVVQRTTFEPSMVLVIFEFGSRSRVFLDELRFTTTTFVDVRMSPDPSVHAITGIAIEQGLLTWCISPNQRRTLLKDLVVQPGAKFEIDLTAPLDAFGDQPAIEIIGANVSAEAEVHIHQVLIDRGIVLWAADDNTVHDEGFASFTSNITRRNPPRIPHPPGFFTNGPHPSS